MHPVLFDLFGLKIYSYGVMIAIGFLLAVILGTWRAKKEGIEPVRIIDLSFYLLIAGILGAKIALFLGSPGYYLKSGKNLLGLMRSGGVILGGIIAAVIVALIYLKKHKLPTWKILDIAAPSVVLGQAIGRLGCFLAGCCYGKFCDASWAVEFTDPIAHKNTGVPLHEMLHPTQLYNSIGNFIIFIILSVLYKKKKFDGQVFLFYMLLYPISRITTEFFRGDTSRITIGGPLSDAQYIGIASIIIAMFFMIKKMKKQDKD